MRAAGNALRSAGLRRGEVLQIATRHPPVLGRDPAMLINLIQFLRFNCGLHKVTIHFITFTCSVIFTCSVFIFSLSLFYFHFFT